ncbi:uncharacterized protein LOC131254896 [Magnolia sinica]|uniref:uncharacterized protein LOC131254896 n=1 Tax=Magnolia sinica TaxID=86752 RepID=UPI0026599370|nr:uncharacterized protein LOC131254896 [Magnolia sinica]
MVAMTIANHKVFRILVDTGSSSDVIYSEAFERMSIDRSCFRPVKTPLHSFAGDKIISERAISLLITAGEGQHQVTLLVDFLVVNVPSALTIDVLDAMEDPPEDLQTVPLEEAESSKVVQLGTSPNSKQRYQMLTFLQQHKNVFAWSHEDMLEISPDVMKRRAFDAERYTTIADEVSKLLSVGFIEEIHYPDWIANVVLVKKASGKWRVCVDYSDLNKACPKDSFPLPRIDQLVDSTAGHERLSFLDAYSGYN